MTDFIQICDIVAVMAFVFIVDTFMFHLFYYCYY